MKTKRNWQASWKHEKSNVRFLLGSILYWLMPYLQLPTPGFRKENILHDLETLAKEDNILHDLETLANEGHILHDLKALVKEQILPWLDDCRMLEESHKLYCDRITSDKAKVPPRRLIHIDKSNRHSVRLVEMDPRLKLKDLSYLILSYCWGEGNETAKTTMDNLPRRLRDGITTTDLPKSIRDAITLTRIMGFEYLWVDAVCIIQDDERKPSDFELEAPKMGGYYANAECCISASLAGDSSDGFLTERLPLRYPIQNVALKLSDPSATQPTRFFEIRESDDNLDKIIHTSPLMQRGWYMQEYLLSPRKLHWTVHGLFLQCPSHTFPEDSTVHRAGLWVGDMLGNPRGIFENQLHYPDVNIGSSWYDLIGIYSKKQLTYEEDRLDAIQGVARHVVERTECEYFNGVLRGYVAEGLAWHSIPSKDFDSRQKQDWKEPRSFPTWCWAGSCPVYFTFVGFTKFLRENHPKRLFSMRPKRKRLGIYDNMSTDDDSSTDEDVSTYGDIDTDEDISTDDTTADTGTKLYIKAPLIEVSFEGGAATIKRGAGLLKRKASDWGKPVAKSYECFLDNRLEKDGYPFAFQKSGDREYCTVMEDIKVKWLLLGRDASEKDRVYMGILVEDVPEKEATYERYGFLEIRVGYQYPPDLEDEYPDEYSNEYSDEYLDEYETDDGDDELMYDYATDEEVQEGELISEENYYGKLRDITLV